MKRNTLKFLVIVVFFAGSLSTYAWNPPSQSPTGANSSGPITTSSVTQTKLGGLILNSGGATDGLFIAKGNVGFGILTPSNPFEIWNTTTPCISGCNTSTGRWIYSGIHSGGYRFSPSVDGLITQLWMFVSNTSEVFYLRLIDVSTGAILASKNLTSSQPFTWISADITPVNVLAGREYIVAVGGNEITATNPPFTNNKSFPFSIQDSGITITQSVYSLAKDTSVFSSGSYEYGFGLVDVTFSKITFTVKSSGLVGIGTRTPTSKLSIVGGIQPGDVPDSECVSNTAGTVRWHSNLLSVCNGSAWISF
ncbi:MAG: hypothetical protein AAB484_02465 [Patescibacteria group bacterium]